MTGLKGNHTGFFTPPENDRPAESSPSLGLSLRDPPPIKTPSRPMGGRRRSSGERTRPGHQHERDISPAYSRPHPE